LSRGDVVFTVSSREAAQWIRREKPLAFAQGLGGDAASVEDRSYTVVAEMVPVDTDIGNPDTLREIEETNGIDLGDLRAATWMRPPERRYGGQRYAHVRLTFTTAEAANRAMVS
ncbi:uncharacterized protein BXZ73DRAFT_3449, partial [Epithele typhae]|uniref:uncharacterized protein n=1 Tax=Epithele typhae TaxID=378194 RepID=UPI0020074D46